MDEPDLEWEFIDGSIVKAHQHSAGAASSEEQGIGKSVAGNTTKIHRVVDGFGLPIEFEITGGEVHDSKIALELMDKLPVSDYVIADKGYDSDEFRQSIRNKSSIPIITDGCRGQAAASRRLAIQHNVVQIVTGTV